MILQGIAPIPRASALLLAGLYCAACFGTDFLPIPHPANLDHMEAPMKRQYAERRQRLDQLLTETGTERRDLARAFGELGQWFHAYQLNPEAEPAYLNARTLAPQEIRWSYYLGLLYVTEGRVDQARQAFEDVLTQQGDDVPSLVRLAELEFDLGQLDTVEDHLEKALAISPDCVRALVLQAQVAQERGTPSESLTLLQRASQLQPDSARVRYRLGIAYRKAGMSQRAEAYLVTAVPASESERLRMQDPLAAQLAALDIGSLRHVRMARKAAANGQHSLALKRFRAAAEINPDLLSAALGTARALNNLGRIEQALEVSYKALGRFPNDVALHVLISSILRRQGQITEAEKHLRRSLELRPGNVPALRDLSDLAADRGDLDTALELIAEARLAEPGKVPLARRHAAFLIRLGRLTEARLALEEDLERTSDQQGLPLVLARLLATAPTEEVRDGQRAFDLAWPAFQESPSLDAAEILVMAAAEQGRFIEAAKCQAFLAALAEKSGRKDLVPQLAQRAADYQQGRKTRDVQPFMASPSSLFVDPTTPACAALFKAP